jgi:hypothetical protein
MTKCRNCGGRTLVRLRRRTFLEKLMKRIGLGPWKCMCCDLQQLGFTV